MKWDKIKIAITIALFCLYAFNEVFGSRLSVKVNKDFTSNDSILFETKDIIYSLNIDGSANINEGGFVRILLESAKGDKYLVYEDVCLDSVGIKVNLDNHSIETARLAGVVPKQLKIFVKFASVDVQSISYDTEKPRKDVETDNKCLHDSLMIERWNEYNRRTGTPWVAAMTPLSKMRYAERTSAMGITSDEYFPDGFEYYAGGIFVFRDYDSELPFTRRVPERVSSSSPFVEEFDWRNRHGKNWMTSVKNQVEPFDNINGNGGCWAFATCATLEACSNLYYNKLMNLDLSEQELGSCTSGNLHSGGFSLHSFPYAKNYGVVNEECFPFQNNETIPCSEKCNDFDYIVRINDYERSSFLNIDSLKSWIINSGPMYSEIFTGSNFYHVLCLCGWGTINDSTKVCLLSANEYPNDSNLIYGDSTYYGMTYWIYKDSYGEFRAGRQGGYLYAIFERDSSMCNHTRITYPIFVTDISSTDIQITDSDNDGYYFWGLGEKPDNCPVCTPDIPDSDDSNPNIGSMDNFGNPLPYSFPYDTVYITSSTTINADTIICGNIVIENNAILSLSANLTMNPAAKILVKSGGHLLVDGGVIINSKIKVSDYGKLTLRNNAILKQHSHGDLNIGTHGILNIEYGQIELIQ